MWRQLEIIRQKNKPVGGEGKGEGKGEGLVVQQFYGSRVPCGWTTTNSTTDFRFKIVKRLYFSGRIKNGAHETVVGLF